MLDEAAQPSGCEVLIFEDDAVLRRRLAARRFDYALADLHSTRPAVGRALPRRRVTFSV